MSIETNKATIRRMAEQIYQARRLDLLEEFFSEQVIGHNAGMPSLTGLVALQASIARSLEVYPDFRLRIDDLIAEGDQVAARWSSQGTHQGELFGVAATGKRITQQGAAVYRLVDARIAELWFYPGDLDLLQQLGVIPV
jgi:predicted ester cyclase